MTTDRECRTYWREGSRVWELDDITIIAEESYYHLKLVQGKHLFANHRVVDSTWFKHKTQVVPSRVWRKVKETHV